MTKKRRLAAKKASRKRKLRAAPRKTLRTHRKGTSIKKTTGASKQGALGRNTKAEQEKEIGAGEAFHSAEPWGVSIEQQNARFRVKHHYMPTPNPDEPTTFDDEVIKIIGGAETREDAERIKLEYESKLEAEAATEDDADG